MNPYMREGEVDLFISEFNKLRDDASIVEWGSGGSTLMILDMLKPKQTFTSIEHDTNWSKKVVEASRGHPNRDRMDYIVTGLPVVQMEINNVVYKNGDYEDHKRGMMGKFLEENPSYISNYIDPSILDKKFKDIMSADLFLVDGLARGAVLATLRVKANKKAKILLHDYVGRELQYDWAVRLFSSFVVKGSFAMLTI